FFYDVLSYPDGRYRKLVVRSLVGLIPLYAVERLEEKWIEPFTEFRANLAWFMKHRQSLVSNVVHTVDRAGDITHGLTILNRDRLRPLRGRLAVVSGFLSVLGIRSPSKAPDSKPFEFDGRVVRYEPAESRDKIKGGNSNWRGPIWFPTCFLLIESLRKLGTAFGETQGVPDPRGIEPLPFKEFAHEVASRLIRIFVRDSSGRPPA